MYIELSSFHLVVFTPMLVPFDFQPFFTKYFKCHDTCGVHNLHGMPAILAAIAGAVAAAHAEAKTYSYEGCVSFPFTMTH